MRADGQRQSLVRFSAARDTQPDNASIHSLDMNIDTFKQHFLKPKISEVYPLASHDSFSMLHCYSRPLPQR